MYVCIYIYRWKGNEKEKENENSSGGWPRGERVIAAITGIKRRKEKDATILGIRTRERERERVVLVARVRPPMRLTGYIQMNGKNHP